MRSLKNYPILFATACALAGCGGGGGGGGFGMNTIPPPPPPPAPPPPPTPDIIPAATTSQQFAVSAADQQLQVRYVAASNSYEVELPQSQNWIAISRSPTDPNDPVIYTGGGVTLWLRPGSFQYSRLFEWSASGDGLGGYEAIGSATPSGGVPVTGGATYAGQIVGRTSEYQAALADDFPVDGSIQLLFDFGLGTLSGSISPNLHQGYTLGSLNFRDTVYSTGSTTFSGKFDTSVAGANSFSGLFTGPVAQELIGNFIFPYRSPIDGKVYQADGVFAGAK